MQLFNSIPGRVYLFIAIIIFAASNSVTRQLTELGANYLIEGRNPISFCNVLFVGNLCALLALIIIYGKTWNPNSLTRLTIFDWISLITVAILAGALAPALIFLALDITTVNNVVLIGRIEPPLVLALSIFILKERVSWLVILGAIISFVGVVLTIVLQAPENTMINMEGVIQIGTGEVMATFGAISLAISTILSKVSLAKIPLGIYTVFRTAVGTVVFFVVVIKLFGASHFTDVFTPVLWQWMAIYSLIIVVGGQLAWFQGLKTTNTEDVSLASSFSPLAGIVAAYLILGEVPNTAQYIGGSVIILGIILNQIGVSSQVTETDSVTKTKFDKQVDNEIGFKGI
ncbi:MAG: DMT family transporter [Xenococcaceae cyanobacterium MO_207.B15]|nr:DMT family transporter [Xenococcaceae cyanobacterium MO_207.B15]